MASVWGIDIGKAALKAVKLRKTKEGLEIQAIEHIPYPVEDDADERQEHVNDAIRNFQTKHKLGGDQVVVAIPGLNAFSRFIKLPPVDKSKIGMMVRMEAQQQIPFPIAEVNWDFVKIDREYDPGEEIEVGIFATRSELVDGFLGDLQANKLVPDVVTIAPLAVYNFIRYNTADAEGGTIILDIGSEHTDLVIIDGERFWIRNLRIAGNDITKALAERFKIPFGEAETLKRKSSKSQQSKKIFSAMQSVLKDLVGEIHRSVGFFKSQAEDLDIQRVVLMGDGAKVKGLDKFLKEQLKFKVKRVQRLEQDKFLIDPDVDLDVLKKHLLGFGVALGLATQGVGRAKCSINLAPQQLQIQSQLRTKLPWAAGAAVCTWLALGLSYVYWSGAKDQLQETLNKVKGVQRYDAIQSDANEARAQLPKLQTELSTLATLGEGRTVVLEFLDAVRAVLPRDNPSIPDMEPKEREADVNEQIANFVGKLEQTKLNQKKIWILDWNVRRKLKKEGETDTVYKVKMRVAKALPRDGGRRVDEIRDDIKDAFVTPLVNRLLDKPFWVRNGQKSPPEYGEINVGTPEEIFGLDPSRRTDDGRNSFFCVMVGLEFEIGAPPKKDDAGEGE